MQITTTTGPESAQIKLENVSWGFRTGLNLKKGTKTYWILISC